MSLMKTRYKNLFSEHSRVPLSLLLNYEFKDRKQKNKQYSLRAFSAALKVPVSTLSRFLRGERSLPREMIESICNQLNLPIEQIAELNDRPKRSSRPSAGVTYLDPSQYPEIEFRDFALLELLKLTHGRVDEEFLADSMQTSVQALRKAKERLEANGLLKVKGPLWVPLHSETSFRSLAERSTEPHQISMMKSAIESIQKGPGLGKRSHSGFVIAVNTKRWLEAVEKIDAFRKELKELLSGEEETDQIYQMTISLYPVSKKIPR